MVDSISFRELIEVNELIREIDRQIPGLTHAQKVAVVRFAVGFCQSCEKYSPGCRGGKTSKGPDV